MTNFTYICVPCRQTARGCYIDLRCPRCSRSMRDMGSKFRPPGRRDDRAWRKLTLLLHARDGAYRMCPCWSCQRPTTAPGTLAETKKWLERKRTHRQHEVPQWSGWVVGVR